MVDVCGLSDLTYVGRSWTYEKKVAGGSYCRVHLDRAMACAGWMARFPLATLSHHYAAASDHGPIVLRWDQTQQSQRVRRRKKSFRYEVMWETHDSFAEALKQSWCCRPKASTLAELHKKLSEVSGSLNAWDSATFGNVNLELKEMKGRLEVLRSDPSRLGPTHEEIKLVDRIVELNHREEIMWKQRSRITWLAEGDKNTRFFHLRASQRRRRNKIVRLKRTDGSVTENENEMADLATAFYKGLYASEGVTNTDQLLETVPVKVTREMNDQLLKTFSSDEVKTALFQMFLTKAPGPDGYPAHFFSITGSCVGRR